MATVRTRLETSSGVWQEWRHETQGSFPYDTGFVPWVASRLDPRFSWALYVPKSANEDTPAPVLALIHGSTRHDYFREGFRDYAERTGSVVITPLFPIGGADAQDIHGYKRLADFGVRYDLLLLDMIAQAAEIWPLAADRFALFGYSGGGQFVHRFAYAHPDRLSALSIGAPGHVTMPDPDQPWPAGVGDLEEKFGIAFDADALARVPVHLVVGANDTEVWEIARTPDDPLYVKGVNDEESNRVTKLKLLEVALAGLGCKTQFDAVEGVAHDGRAMTPAVTAWLEATLRLPPPADAS